MIAEELENKGALLLQKREEYSQKVQMKIDGHQVDTTTNMTEAISDIKHSI